MNVYELLEGWMRDSLHSCGIEDGVPWAVAKGTTYSGGYNGYAWCSKGHPWLAANWADIPNTGVPWGEITFRGDNWVGFDSGHSGQWWPDGEKRWWRGDEEMTAAKIVEWAKMTAHNVAKTTETLENRALGFDPTETDLLYLDLLKAHKEAEQESRTWDGHEVTRLMAEKLVQLGWARA